MNTIRATLEPDPDGTLHLPLPPELRQGKVHVVATVERAQPAPEARLKGFGCLQGKIGLSPDFDEPLDDFREYME